MAKVQLQYGKDATMKKMAAKKIVAGQEIEIGQMQDWLKKNAKQERSSASNRSKRGRLSKSQ